MSRPLLLLLLLGLGSFAPVTGRAGQELPFTLANGFILLHAQVAERSESLTFLLDSGASASVLHLDTARRLRLPLGARQAVQGVGAEATAYRLSGVQIQGGGEKLDEAALALNLRRATELCGCAVDGLLGMGFFERRVVQIDFGTQKLRVLSEASAPPPGATVLPLREINGTFCVSVAVNGSQPRWTRLDTGCNDALHWVIPRRSERTRRGTTIGFIDRQRDLTRARVRLGELDLQDVETSLHGQPLFPGEAGLLGNGILSQYVVTIDAVERVLFLRPR